MLMQQNGWPFCSQQLSSGAIHWLDVMRYQMRDRLTLKDYDTVETKQRCCGSARPGIQVED
jgi:hypothetical protein